MGLFLDSLPFILIGLVVLVPTRRLFLAGWPSRLLLAYYLIVVGLGAIVAELRAPARYLVPILVVMYIAPFVTAGAGLARIIGGRGSATAPPVKPVVRHVYPIAIPAAMRRREGERDGNDAKPASHDEDVSDHRAEDDRAEDRPDGQADDDRAEDARMDERPRGDAERPSAHDARGDAAEPGEPDSRAESRATRV